MKNPSKSSGTPYLDYDDMEDQIDVLWDLLESRKYYIVRDECQRILDAIEKDLADDFGQDIQTTTLYEDGNEERRECYLEVLNVYQKALQSVVIELIIQTDGISDIDQNFERYDSLSHDIQDEMSKVAYLLGRDYKSRIFITPSDLEKLDKLMREHCQFLLKSEFFEQFKIIIQELDSLDRKDFHKVTEPYKNLRSLCGQCLQILDVMKDGRFFGEKDTFIEDYDHDVKIYLQVLWYLAIKTDLNKADKFLNPNTYSQGLDKHCQVFAAISLMEQVIPHLEEARNVGLSDKAATDLLEDYAEYLYKIITLEESRTEKEELHPPDPLKGGVQEADRIAAEKKLQKLKYIKETIEKYTKNQEKIKYRIDFTIKLFKRSRFALRFGKHKRIPFPNPEGRVLRDDTNAEQTLEALKDPIFPVFFEELKKQYRSQFGLKLQHLRWSWFAERELPEGYFERPKYNYLKYIHTRWKKKEQDHYETLQQLSRREKEEDEDDD
jgi:hypothetical protein